jgi:hypothetical protein
MTTEQLRTLIKEELRQMALEEQRVPETTQRILDLFRVKAEPSTLSYRQKLEVLHQVLKSLAFDEAETGRVVRFTKDALG